jgi:threonine dehydrogenase-like Zn-dependent dehydrogenase
MRAVRCIDHEAVCVEVPEPAGDGVRVTIASAGVCGSDLHMVDLMPLAATLGHEFAGTLDDGRLVAVEPMAACRECDDCRAGRPYHCRHGFQTFGVDADGGMAERCIVPESAIVPMPTGAEAWSSALVEPLAVAVHGVRLAGDLSGLTTAIIGAGTIGLCLVPALQAVGVERIDVLARHDGQREAAQRLGARIGDQAPSAWHVVFDAAGTAESLAQAIRMARPGGRVVLVGVYWDGTVPLPAIELCMKEVRLIPSMMYGHDGAGRDFDIAAGLLAARPEIASTLITHRFPLDAVTEAFAVARDRASGAIKVVLEP